MAVFLAKWSEGKNLIAKQRPSICIGEGSVASIDKFALAQAQFSTKAMVRKPFYEVQGGNV